MQFIGPIVGKITDSSARVVVQPDRAGLVTVSLKSAGFETTERTARATLEDPVVGVSFDNLTPQTAYDLSIMVDGEVIAGRVGRVTTLAKNSERFRAAAVSCNFTVREGNSRLWQDLLENQIRTGNVSTVLHIGDQVYMDNAFGQSIQDVRDHGRTDKVRKDITARFRRVYEYAWNYAPTREVLATASNLMIWDDHEVRNGWGSHKRDRDPKSNRYWVGSIARRLFQDFQRRLWSDPDPSVKHEAHAHVFGKVALVFLDQRGARSFAYDSERPYLGRAQWDWLRANLQAPAFAEVTALVIITSVPLLYVGDRAAGVGGVVASDLRDQWSHPKHRDEQRDLVSLISEWKSRSPARTVAVLGGDVHVGARTILEQLIGGEWKHLFDQFITSPITNEPPGPLSFFGLKTLLSGEEKIGDAFRYRHASLSRRRNYAVLEIQAPALGQASIVGTLHEDAAENE